MVMKTSIVKESCRVGSLRSLGFPIHGVLQKAQSSTKRKGKNDAPSPPGVTSKEVRINGSKLLRMLTKESGRAYIGRNTKLMDLGSSEGIHIHNFIVEETEYSNDCLQCVSPKGVVVRSMNSAGTDMVSYPERRKFWMRIICVQLHYCCSLHTLRLCSDWVSDIHLAWTLQQCFQSMLTLNALDLSTTTEYGGFGVKEMEILASGMKKLVYLTSLNLSGNKLGDRGALQLSQVLKHTIFVEQLKVQNCCFGAYGFGDISSSVVKHLLHIQTFHIGQQTKRASGLLLSGLTSFFNSIKTKPKSIVVLGNLLSLNLSGSGIGYASLEHLVTKIDKGCMKQLRELNLAHNYICNKGAQLLGLLFQFGKLLHLRCLDLHGNCISELGAKCLLQSVPGLLWLQDFLDDFDNFDDMCTNVFLDLPSQLVT